MTKNTLFTRLPKLRDLTMTFRMSLIVVMLGIAAVAITVAYFSVLNITDQAQKLERRTTDIVHVIGEIKATVIEVRFNEKSFFLHNDSAYRDATNTSIKTLESLLNELTVLLSEQHTTTSQGNTDADIMPLLYKAMADYKSFFNAVTESRITFGLHNNAGLKSKLIAQVNALESSVLSSGSDNPNLTISVMRLHQAQTEYLAAPNDGSIAIIGSELEYLGELFDEQAFSVQTKQNLIQNLDDYQVMWPEIIGIVSGIKTAEASFAQAANAIAPLLGQTQQLTAQVRDTNAKLIARDRRAGTIRFFIVVCSIPAVLTLAFLLFTLDIIRRVKSVLQAASTIAAGDLSQDIEHTGWRDELGQLSNEMLNMKASLNNVISKTRQASTQVAVASSQVLGGNTELSSRTQEQASSLEEVAASMEEMTGTVDTNAENATRAADLAKGAKDLAGDGDEVAVKTAAAMARIEQSNANIAEVLELIQDFAFQTNLLALNAAVEAARAGEHGRGFGVVASEVRNLAGSSAKAAKDIKAMINESVKNINEGTELVNNSGNTLRQIVSSSSDVSDLVSEIAAASQEQSAGIQQVNRAVVEMDSITQQNAALVEEAAAASEAMGVQAQQLKELVAFFKVEGGENSDTENREFYAQTETAATPTRSNGADLSPVTRSAEADRQTAARSVSDQPINPKHKDEEWSQF
ncbi:MAG: HAMP domain-containing protein [Porticoccaceae bacterium]|nr:HAMP domain-containing protein [Porticoccaceae bacterium]